MYYVVWLLASQALTVLTPAVCRDTLQTASMQDLSQPKSLDLNHMVCIAGIRKGAAGSIPAGGDSMGSHCVWAVLHVHGGIHQLQLHGLRAQCVSCWGSLPHLLLLAVEWLHRHWSLCGHRRR